jgi:hypothetical protein
MASKKTGDAEHGPRDGLDGRSRGIDAFLGRVHGELIPYQWR